jgi:hypothetical protein
VQINVNHSNIDTLIINKDDLYVDIINNRSSELIWSFSFNDIPNISKVKSKIQKNGNNITGVILTNAKMIVFDARNIITNIESK